MFVRNKGQSFATKSVVVQWSRAKNQLKPTKQLVFSKIGYTATKKIGKANVRNRAKRRLREALRKIYNQIKTEYDIVLIARTTTASCNWDKLQNDLNYGLKKSKLMK